MKKRDAERKETTFTNVIDHRSAHGLFNGIHLIWNSSKRNPNNHTHTQCQYSNGTLILYSHYSHWTLHLERANVSMAWNKNGLNLFESQMKNRIRTTRSLTHSFAHTAMNAFRFRFYFQSHWPYLVAKKNASPHFFVFKLKQRAAA